MLPLLRYRFTLGIPVRVRQASEDEWTVGSYADLSPTGDTRGLLDGELGAVPRGYREKRWLRLAPFLPRSGNIWANDRPALLSPKGTYLVLQSWNGSVSSRGATSNFADLFIDIYRWPSKALVAKIAGNSGVSIPDPVLDQTHWITNNDLISNFGGAKRGFLLCHIPE